MQRFNSKVLESVRQVLDAVLHDHMTSAVLNTSKKDEADDLLYFDDFLGDGDRDIFNRSKVSLVHYENLPMKYTEIFFSCKN